TVADAGMTATRAVFLFDMIHPFALATQRVAGFALGLSTCLFGWGVSDGKVLPRWLGTGGLAAGAVAMAFALVFREDTKADQAARIRTLRPAQPAAASGLRDSTCSVTTSPGLTLRSASRNAARVRLGTPFTATMMSGPPGSSLACSRW